MKQRLLEYRYLVAFTAAYAIGAGSLYWLNDNWEFLTYLAVAILGGGLLLATLDRTHLDRVALWGISIGGMAHMLGGGVRVGDGILYEVELFSLLDGRGDLYILKVDQVVHFFGYAIVGLALYQLIAFRSRPSTHWGMIVFLAWAAAMGVGAFNEVVEYLATLWWHDTHVGGQHNTGLDLIFNLCGAFLGALVERHRQRGGAPRAAKHT